MPDTALMLRPVERWREVSVRRPTTRSADPEQLGEQQPRRRPENGPHESERAMHDVQTDEPVLRVVEPFGQGPQDLEPE